MSDTKNKFVHSAITEAIKKQKANGSINITSLAIGDVVAVETQHSRYTLKILELSTTHNLLEVSSTNKKYPGRYTRAVLQGTTIAPGASTICPQHFALGGSLELALVDDSGSFKIMTTSSVEKVFINEVQILPIVEANA